MKKIALILTLALVVGLFSGCAGTPVVYYTDCTCPTGAHDNTPVETKPVETTPAETFVPAEGAVKTGLAIVTDISGSTDGEAKFELTLVGVTVDDNGVIQSCAIDGINTSVKFDTTGAITTDLTVAPQTKNELGANYNMVTYGGAIAEWDAQAAALAAFACGKTVEELKTGAIDETGYAPEGSDLATSATIYLGGYVAAIEKAVANAQHLGAQSGDKLILCCTTGLGSSAAATAEAAGNAQLDVDVTALTMAGDIITSCVIDAVQAKVGFDAAGVITSELTAPQTKTELGDAYGMVAWAGATAEWYEQAASFASYITGMTAAEVAGIAVNEGTKPVDADLSTSVTIAIGGFQALIAKACS
ncbi:MAG: hypothetical protein IJ960_02825 [Oscillospiraceae bacterium]|nr:hypothetical protein [Oscillospiraceae bacterium]